MIHVDRSTVQEPASLGSSVVFSTLADAELHFEDVSPRARQTRFDFGMVPFDPDVRDALDALFSSKCAFCESAIGPTAPGMIAQFRPRQEAVGLSGKVDRAHYWWLAFAWDNLFLVCESCNYERGATFPVHGRRARAGGTVANARVEEQALLLDPCFDQPRKHLLFDQSGEVTALTEQGDHTIRAFKLNRASLVAARRDAVGRYLSVRRRDSESLAAMPYAAAIRDALARRPQQIDEIEVSFLRSVVPPSQPVEPVELERIDIRDFRGIGELSIDLCHRNAVSKDARSAPWTVLLGENGHGKSTILQAIAIVLMGDAARARLKLSARGDLIRSGADGAEISLTVRGQLDPRVVRLERVDDGVKIETYGDDTPAALAAYGASRIPPPFGRDWLPRRYRVRPRVENLFDPHAELMDARNWLNSLDPMSFDYVARALRQLLLEPETTVLDRTLGDVWLEREDDRVSLLHLSDGYRAMVVLAVDLMSFFHMRFGSMDAAEGVVLIDELGAHLHPRWQMRIVDAFRSAFPRLQVIATTHDPLCLRGLDDGEVIVLRRTLSDRIFALQGEELPPLRGLRVDELLTSEAFGLHSTLDEELDALFTRYYELLQRPERDGAARDEIASLRKQLNGYRQFGATLRERLALEAADAFVARQRTLADGDERRQLSAETRARLMRIWAGSEG